MLKLLLAVLSASRVPNLLIIGMSQFLAANMLYRHQLISFPDIQLVLLILTTMMVAAAGYIINDYYDLKIDMVNRPKQVIVGRNLSRRKAILMHTLISSIAVLIGFMVSTRIGLLHFFSVTLLWYFSNHLRRYFIGKVVIAILTAICILSVALVYQVVSYHLMAFAAFGAAIVWIRELIKDMENAPGEKIYGVVSVVEVWGFRGTKLLIGVISLAGASLLAYFIIKVNTQVIMFYYLALAPVVVIFAILLIQSDTREQFRRLRYFTNLLILAGMASMLFV